MNPMIGESEHTVQHLCATRPVTVRELAEVLHVAPSTVSRWRKAKAPPRPVGRPRRRMDLGTCCRVVATIAKAVGRTAVRALRKLFPKVSRAWLSDTLKRYHKHLAWRRRQQQARLEWTKTGSVWAMDFTALQGRDGPHALSVRDLASRKVLHAGIVASECADAVIAELEELFARHGAPLVLKCDNGPAFIADKLKRLLERHQVLGLYSPPRTPRYNGACEAGIGALKRVAADLQLTDPFQTSLGRRLSRAAAILDALPVTRRSGAPSRAKAWQDRSPCTPELRATLRERYAVHARTRRRESGIAPHQRLTHAEQASLDRHAIRDALCDLHLVVIRRP